MTSPPLDQARVADPEHPLFPHTFGGWPSCTSCFRRRDLAWTVPGPVRLCRPCAVAVAAGRYGDLPSGAELAAVWQTLARLHHNREVTTATLDATLTKLRPGLPLPAGRWAVRRLTGALLRLQAAGHPATVLEEAGPEHGAYANHWRAIASDALAELTGGAP